jgi:hypothetical protein
MISVSNEGNFFVEIDIMRTDNYLSHGTLMEAAEGYYVLHKR